MPKLRIALAALSIVLLSACGTQSITSPEPAAQDGWMGSGSQVLPGFVAPAATDGWMGSGS